jgi:hypothetical protein
VLALLQESSVSGAVGGGRGGMGLSEASVAGAKEWAAMAWGEEAFFWVKVWAVLGQGAEVCILTFKRSGDRLGGFPSAPSGTLGDML